MFGLWNGTVASENPQQGDLSRSKILVVSPGTNLGSKWMDDCASGLASADPNSISPNTHNTAVDVGTEGGPHFVLSPQTPDGSPHTYGLGFCLFTDGLPIPALPAAGGYTVTIWVLIENTQMPNGFGIPVWAALKTQTGINAQEMWHTFDLNACSIRFQIGNLLDDPAVFNESLGIALMEL